VEDLKFQLEDVQASLQSKVNEINEMGEFYEEMSKDKDAALASLASMKSVSNLSTSELQVKRFALVLISKVYSAFSSTFQIQTRCLELEKFKTELDLLKPEMQTLTRQKKEAEDTLVANSLKSSSDQQQLEGKIKELEDIVEEFSKSPSEGQVSEILVQEKESISVIRKDFSKAGGEDAVVSKETYMLNFENLFAWLVDEYKVTHCCSNARTPTMSIPFLVSIIVLSVRGG
jgi:hypothetical protein